MVMVMPAMMTAPIPRNDMAVSDERSRW